MIKELQNILQLDNTNYLFGAIFILAFTFYYIRQADTNTILSMIVIGGIGFIFYEYIIKEGENSNKKDKNIIETLNNEGKRRDKTFNETHRDNFTLPQFPKKGFKYLQKNKILVEIVKDLDVMRIFNRGAYADLILLMDNYQKNYMYILSDRYKAEAYLPIFTDIGDSILENLYALILVLPLKFKHVYGVDSNELIQKNIDRFILLRRKMSNILESYAKKELGVKVVPLSLPKASDKIFTFESYSKLP